MTDKNTIVFEKDKVRKAEKVLQDNSKGVFDSLIKIFSKDNIIIINHFTNY